MGADADPAIVEELVVTPGNVNDGRAGGGALLDNPGEVYADSAYRGPVFASAVKARGGVPLVAAIAVWSRDEEEALDDVRVLWPDGLVRGRCSRASAKCLLQKP